MYETPTDMTRAEVNGVARRQRKWQQAYRMKLAKNVEQMKAIW
jgi:hypothetical protein